MPPSHLPFEIVAKILKHLGQTPLVSNVQNPDLLACSLVSRTWSSATREHLWDKEWFGVPQTEHRLTALKHLCASPLYSLRLDKVAYVWVDPHNLWISPFFEWCPPLFTGIDQIMVRDHDFVPAFNALQKGIFAELPALKSLSIYEVRFPSIHDFHQFLSSLKALECLCCYGMDLEDKETEEPDRLLIKSSLRTLVIDFDSFFALFYRRVALTGLQELEFEEPFKSYFCNNQQHSSDDRRWRDIGDMLDHTGRRLVKLKLRLGKIGVSSCIKNSTDLPTKTPMLRELEVQIEDQAGTNDILMPMISFKRPHLHLSSLKISYLPDNLRKFDRILELSTPSLRELIFPVFGVVSEDTVGGRWFRAMTLTKLHHGSEDWHKAKNYMLEVESLMPWCEKKQCLFPVFISSWSSFRRIVDFGSEV